MFLPIEFLQNIARCFVGVRFGLDSRFHHNLDAYFFSFLPWRPECLPRGIEISGIRPRMHLLVLYLHLMPFGIVHTMFPIAERSKATQFLQLMSHLRQALLDLLRHSLPLRDPLIRVRRLLLPPGLYLEIKDALMLAAHFKQHRRASRFI
jgi:hypothetical protein